MSKQIDNFKQMLDSIQYDIRALLIKLSDRLHNMRTLGSMRADKQMKIASETDYFYAPLANRLGLYEIKSELENLSMKFRSPQEYERIEKKIVSYMRLHHDDIEEFLKPIRAALEEAGIHADVYARPRSVYALWRKMQNTGLSFKELEHVHLVNIIFPFDTKSGASEKNQCLAIYSILTDLYKERPYSMINYVDQPKENGYQSLHVQVMTHMGGWAEVHISTETMHRNSQLGCVMDRTETIETWVNKFKSILRDIAQMGNEGGFMESVVSSFYNDDIIVFTPKGNSIVLPKNSSVLDMAYEIHTNIGNRANFARINGKLCSIFTTLKRGDRVEVGTSDYILPTREWLKHVCTYKARRAINVSVSKNGAAAGEFPYKLCPDCNPLPGDEIIGFKQAGGILVHKRNCPSAITLSAKDGDSIVDVTLPVLPGRFYPTNIIINSVDRPHLLMDLVKVISEDLKLSIDSLHTVTEDYIVTTNVRIEVPSAFELFEAVRIIEQVPGVEEVRMQ
jgi:GTP pyrophosphokinase